MKQDETKNRGGRPKKFHEASRPITVTLPDRTLARLHAIDRDRARAIVKAVDAAGGAEGGPSNSVEVVEVEKGVGIILVGPSLSLRRIPGLRLVEVAPMRYLVSLPTGMAVDSLEIAILDLIENLQPEEEGERAPLNHLRDLIRHLRRAQHVSKAEILFVRTRPR